MNISGALQTGLIGLNRTLDNTQKVAGDQVGNGKPEAPELASGRGANVALQESTVNPATEAATTKVVTDASEVLGTNIDTRA
ncbi:hypothetical protein [Neptunomonas concharum]|jgi:hypothetical protein|uniref:Uncharacterized protein n=1 Tax=Neptunomonas concharum TaxID=1031538 RepID=A0A5P1R8F2_9GAMM|nr:hypothetical protein [Neptunomonas concharum]QEQ95929.1 hypothetical protein F0U83_03970 [Neptunomonas concharum]